MRPESSRNLIFINKNPDMKICPVTSKSQGKQHSQIKLLQCSCYWPKAVTLSWEQLLTTCLKCFLLIWPLRHTHSVSLKEQKRETLWLSHRIFIRFLNIRHCTGAGDKQSALGFHSRQKDKRWEISRSMGIQDGEHATGHHTGGNATIHIQDSKKRKGKVSQKTRGCFSCVAQEVTKEGDRCKCKSWRQSWKLKYFTSHLQRSQPCVPQGRKGLLNGHGILGQPILWQCQLNKMLFLIFVFILIAIKNSRVNLLKAQVLSAVYWQGKKV